MLPGDVVADRFVIERNAGAGGMGVVYRAHDRVSDGPVALKVLRQGGDIPADRFAREIELLAKLDHPHIVGYVTHGLTAERLPFLVMPWLEGEDLQQRLRGGPLTVDETLTIATCVAGALACLHAQGLVHRDLKPSNLFLPGGNVSAVQLIDLGIARHMVADRPMTISGQLVGTPGYMAPEEARGDRELAPTIDVFALGCVLHECLTGRPLFSGSNVMAVLAKIILEDAPRVRETRRDVPEALDAILHRMVSKDPSRRPRDGAELGQWLGEMWGTPLPSSRVSAVMAPALTDSEQRVVTILMAAVPTRQDVVIVDSTRVTRSRFDEMSSASLRFGVRVHVLADGTAVAMAPEGMSAADQASLLARFGRHIVEALPSARVALATGTALTGGRVPVGEAIDRGARLVRNDALGPGLRADDVSAALLDARFDLRREGDSFVVADERPALDATRPLLGKPTACVGRDRELAILDATFCACVDEATAAVVLVTAPPGVGKSRLRHELVRRMRGPDAAWREERPDVKPPLVLLATGDPLTTSTPYAVVAQAIRRAAGLRDREAPEIAHQKLEAHVAARLPGKAGANVAELLAEIVGVPYDEDGRPALRAARESAAGMNERMRAAFETLVRGWCATQPVILALEDLHWADTESVKLVDRVLRTVRGAPLLVVALARPEIHDRFPGLWAHRNVTEIHLTPLGDRACTKIVRDAMGDRATPERVREIVARSEGNAFFLEELIRASMEAGMPSEPRASVAPALPHSIVAVAQARLERLDADARRVLRAASVFGETFWTEGVCALLASTPSEIEPVLSALVQHETVVPRDDPRLAARRELSFRHALLRGAAYATLTGDDRTLGHRLAAKWLETAGEDLEVVATHWLEAGERGEAAGRFQRAGLAHVARAQLDAAARCFARSVLASDKDSDAIAAITARIGLLADVLESTRGIDALGVAAGIERHIDAPLTVGATRTDPGFARGVFERALGRIDGHVSAEVMAEAAARSGAALAALGDFQGAERMSATARDRLPSGWRSAPAIRRAMAHVAYMAGDFGTVADLLGPDDAASADTGFETKLAGAVAVVAVDGGARLERGLALVDSALRDVHPDRTTALHAVLASKARLLCLNFAREHAKAAEVAAAGAELAQRAGLVYERTVHLHMLGQARIKLGDAAGARAALATAGELAADPRAVDRGHDEPLLAYLDGIDGDPRAPGRIEVVADRFQQASYPLGELHARYWLGRLLATRRDARAHRELGRALDLARRFRIRAYEEDCIEDLALIA